jgi:hypothetical protein
MDLHAYDNFLNVRTANVLKAAQKDKGCVSGTAILHLPARFIAEDEYQKRFPVLKRKAPERKP